MQKRDEFELNINEQITAQQVRLVGDNIPEQGVYPILKALRMAEELELDLVEISAKADPPVCRILDYQKYLYQRRKKAKEMKANATKVVIKEIRFGPNTDEHDFQFKLKHAQEFLQEGSKVKASIFFRGRSIMFKDQGEKQLLRFAVELEEFGRPENMPVLEGKRMTMMIAPNKKK
ncbi:MAG: translation initiation factor IF-3 [Bacteroidales bacterium]|jgi:translation initiation factor IF-3|nr:translation initiation factor IF-3 [Bacteroidales bacterium]